MNNLIHAELLKLRTTRMIYGLALAALAFAAISAISAISTAGKSGGGPALSTAAGIRNVMSAGLPGGILALVIGILIMAGEFRHNTATSTFLISATRPAQSSVEDSCHRGEPRGRPLAWWRLQHTEALSTSRGRFFRGRGHPAHRRLAGLRRRQR